MLTDTLSQQQIEQLRAETGGVAAKIHFNNAGSSLPPNVVVDTVVDYLREEALIGGYEAEAKYSKQLQNTHALIARLINANIDEVAVVENASTGWALAFNGLDLKPGDEIITSEMEYITNVIGFINVQKLYGIKVIYIPNDERGNFSMPHFEAAINKKTKLIAITHIASTTGGMMPINQIGAIARRHNILYLVDACQSAGHTPIDVEAIQCDMLSVTGRKYLRAPRGTGFLYVRKQVQHRIRPFFIDGHSIQWINESDYKLRDDAQRFELYENNRAIILGLGKAIEYALNIGVDRIWQRIQHLAALTRSRLSAIEGVSVHDNGDQQCGIVTFTVKDIDSQRVKEYLDNNNINASVGLAKSTLIFMNRNHLASVVRASVHYYNTEEEIETFCTVLKDLINTQKA